MSTVQYPVINGNYYDFSSIRLLIGTTRITGIKGIDYSSEQTPGDVYGTAPQMLGQTRGQNKCNWSLEMFMPEFYDFQQALQGLGGVLPSAPNTGGAGLHEVNFLINVMYAEAPPVGAPGQVVPPVQDHAIYGCRANKVSASHSNGTDALTMKIEGTAKYIKFNNAIPLNLLLEAGTAILGV